MNKSMQRDSKTAVRAKSNQLVADLKAIRAQIAQRKNSESSLEELEGLQQRLFEVWVAEQLALAMCRQEQATAGMQATQEELAQARSDLAEARKELAELRKEVLRLGRVAEKFSAQLNAIKTRRAGRGR